MSDPISVAEIATRYQRCAAANVYDTLDKMGLPNQCLSLEIKPLLHTMHIAGPAFTVRGEREPRLGSEMPQGDKFANHAMFKQMFPHCVVTLNAEKDDQVGHWGEMMSLTAKQHGAAGIVMDGGIRDFRFLLNIPDWPVFVRYTSPIELAKRWRFDEVMVPIFMTGTLTRLLRVDPGDWIVGDADGVMVIPQTIAYETLLKVEDLEKKEEATRRDLAAGVAVEEVYKKHGRM